MAKNILDAVLDLMLTQAEGTIFTVCSAQPTNIGEVATFELATAALAGAYAKANGDISGRKNTTPAQTAVPITNTGLATHVVEHTVGQIGKITTCPSQVLTSGGTVDAAAYDHELQQVT